MPKPVSQTSQVALLTRILAGLISLWMRPRPWSLASAAARPMAKRKNEAISQGCPRSRNRGSPPGSSQQRKPTIVGHEPQRPSRPGGVELVPQLESVLQARDGSGRRRGGQGHSGEDRQWLAVWHGPGQEELPILPLSFRHVCGQLRHAAAFLI